MQKKGFFCFALALSLAFTTAAVSDAAQNTIEKISEAKTAAIALEQATLKRFELETNADKAIAKATEKSVKEGKKSSEEIKQKIDTVLFELFLEEKEKSQETISFFQTSSSSKNYAKLPFEKSKAMEKSDLEQVSKVLSINLEKKVFAVDYGITGGLMKNKIIFAIIENNGAKQIFLLPIDYSKKTVVVE